MAAGTWPSAMISCGILFAPSICGVQAVDLHCTGGFVVSVLYGLARPTNDLDIITVEPFDLLNPLLQLGGAESALAHKHGVHVDAKARVAILPCNYVERLTELYPGAPGERRVPMTRWCDPLVSEVPRRDNSGQLQLIGWFGKLF